MSEVVLITGASKGIGKATALLLANMDYTVYATARKSEDIKKVVEDGKKAGKIDILINNAGYGQFGPFEEISEQKLRDQMETNFFGVARMARLVIPIMREKGEGLIINISSVAGRIGFPLGSPYNASKFAVEGLSESLRAELNQFNIHVVLVEPGFIMTEFAQTAEDRVKQF